MLPTSRISAESWDLSQVAFLAIRQLPTKQSALYALHPEISTWVYPKIATLFVFPEPDGQTTVAAQLKV